VANQIESLDNYGSRSSSMQRFRNGSFISSAGSQRVDTPSGGNLRSMSFTAPDAKSSSTNSLRHQENEIKQEAKLWKSINRKSATILTDLKSSRINGDDSTNNKSGSNAVTEVLTAASSMERHTTEADNRIQSNVMEPSLLSIAETNESNEQVGSK
jgi:hypothetical protein